MQIVIDIDEGIAQGIIKGNNDEPSNIVRSFQATIADAIKHGVPLPSGHGRLGDLDALEKEMIKRLPSVISQSKIGRCKDCKWWKDSDGIYRRGIGAESQCPINRREVLEGNGYCYMFELEMQESGDKE